MLIFKYFVTVGAALFAGLFALNAYFAAPGKAIAMYNPTTASLPVATPAPKPEKAALEVAPPQKLATKPAARRSKHSRRSR